VWCGILCCRACVIKSPVCVNVSVCVCVCVTCRVRVLIWRLFFFCLLFYLYISALFFFTGTHVRYEKFSKLFLVYVFFFLWCLELSPLIYFSKNVLFFFFVGFSVYVTMSLLIVRALCVTFFLLLCCYVSKFGWPYLFVSNLLTYCFFFFHYHSWCFLFVVFIFMCLSVFDVHNLNCYFSVAWFCLLFYRVSFLTAILLHLLTFSFTYIFYEHITDVFFKTCALFSFSCFLFFALSSPLFRSPFLASFWSFFFLLFGV
jgi:hypothetical protein